MSIFLLSILVLSSLLFFKKPKHNRGWRPEQSRLPSAKIDGDLVYIKNIRNCSYRSETDFDLDYYDKQFDLKNLKSMDIVVQPFKKMSLMGHLFLSFGFVGGDYISVSIEARRKKKKEFSAFWGLFRRFELIYIIVDEGDIMRLRPLHHKDNVYIYPLKLKKEKIKNIFLDVINRVNSIEEKSEFYNTLTNSCVTNLFEHIRKAGSVNIPKSWKFIFPSTLDKFLYDIDLIKTKMSFDDLKNSHLINKKAEKYRDEKDYSAKIRGKI